MSACAVVGCRVRGAHGETCPGGECQGCVPRRAMPGCSVCDVCEDRAWEACQTIARTWAATEAQLTAPVTHGEPVKSSRSPGLDLNPRTVEARQRIATEVAFWAHVLTDAASTLRPRGDDVPALARFLGSNLRHLTRHHDEGVAGAFAGEIRALGRLAVRTAYPKGARLFEPGIPCVEHGTDDRGVRVVCVGTYGAWVWEGMGLLPDLRCSEDQTHVLTPEGFRRLGRAASKLGEVFGVSVTLRGA